MTTPSELPKQTAPNPPQIPTQRTGDQPVAELSAGSQELLGFVQESMGAIPENATDEERRKGEADILGFAQSMEENEAALSWLDEWVKSRSEPNPKKARFLEHVRDRQTETPAGTEDWEEHASGLLIPKAALIIGGKAVVETPGFEEQALDDSRTNPIKYSRVGGESRLSDEGSEVMTEQESLLDLLQKLGDFVDGARSKLGQGSKVISRAESLMKGLNFIGESEYQAGAEVIARKWKEFLDEDQNRQICIPDLVSRSKKYKETKSDEYFRDRVLATFSDDELEQYSGRIVTDIRAITARPQDVLFVLGDDWSISGSQIERALGELIGLKTFRKLLDAGSVAVHNLITSPERLEQGQLVRGGLGRKKGRLPVFAPFVARTANGAEQDAGAHIAGAHSVVNYDFADVLRGMVRASERYGFGITAPVLASLVSPYRYTGYKPGVRVTPDKLERRR